MMTKKLIKRQIQQAKELLRFNFQIKYIKRKKNIIISILT